MNKEDDKELVVFSKTDRELQSSINKGDFRIAINRFRDNAPAIPATRLYDAYRWLKEQIDSAGPDSASEGSHFNHVFLRILEERGENTGGIYRSVLRDSPEYKLLHGMIGGNSNDEQPQDDEEFIEEQVVDKTPERLTLKKILSLKGESIDTYLKDEWDALVDEYFITVDGEKELVRACSNLLNRVRKRSDCEDYHIESIIEYVFGRLLNMEKLQVSTKDFAMKTLNTVSGKSEVWKRLHKLYTGIIQK